MGDYRLQITEYRVQMTECRTMNGEWGENKIRRNACVGGGDFVSLSQLVDTFTRCKKYSSKLDIISLVYSYLCGGQMR